MALARFRSFFGFMLVVCAAALWPLKASAIQALPFADGFEAPPHTLDLPPANGWTATDPTSAVVQNATKYELESALEISPTGYVDQTFEPTSGVVWIDGYHQGDPSAEAPDLTGLTSGAAVVAFTFTSGVVCLNGDGLGGGQWVETGQTVDPGVWRRVTLELDYGARTYNCYINGVLRAEDMGFLFNATDQLNGFRATAGANTSFLDYLRVQTAQPGGLGDWTAIASYLTGETSDPDGLDANNDGIIDISDVITRILDMQ